MKVAVIILFLVDPLVGTVFEPFGTMVLFNTGMYFQGVWSTLRTRDGGMSLSSIFLTMPCRYDFWSSFLRESGMGTFPVVPSLLTKPIPLNKLCAQHDCLRSMQSTFSSGYRLIRTMATDSAMLRLTAPWRPRTASN